MRGIVFLILGLIVSLFVSCSTKNDEKTRGDVLENKADLFLEKGEFGEAKVLYEILENEYDIDINEKLDKAKEELEFEKNNIKLEEINNDFDYKKELNYLKSIDSNYGNDYEINEIIVFKEKAIEINYEELCDNSVIYLNSRIYNQGNVYKILKSDEKGMELIVNLGNKKNLKLIKIYYEFSEEFGEEFGSYEFKIGDPIMFHGYYMGIYKEDKMIIKEGKLPVVKSIITTGLAG